MSEAYAHPEVVVEPAWVAEHLHDPSVRLVESNQDLILYNVGHIPGAVRIDWLNDLSDGQVRDIVDAQRFAQVMEANGIGNDTTVVLYGDMYNWWAAYTFWVFKLFGHRDVRIMNGGRAHWIAEAHTLTRAPAHYAPTSYQPAPRDDAALRVFYPQVLEHSERYEQGCRLLDGRSAAEYRGETSVQPEYPQMSTLRAGHIPTALHLPGSLLVNEDSTFKPRAELEQIMQQHGITSAHDIICYCLVGVMSSYTWFVLTSLLGYPRVRNYDGSWTEWGNLVRMPVATEQHE